MKCPSCGSDRIFHSRAKSRRDRFIKGALPITFYRCHECNYRRAHFRGWKQIGNYLLSLVGYGASAVLVLVIIVSVLTLALMFLGVQIP